MASLLMNEVREYEHKKSQRYTARVPSIEKLCVTMTACRNEKLQRTNAHYRLSLLVAINTALQLYSFEMFSKVFEGTLK